MPSFKTSRHVAHGADEMFDLVADVESYPRFVPLCRDLRVRRKTEDAGLTILVAEMEVGYKAIRERFTSRVTCDQKKRRILVEYIDGPFKHLENWWVFYERDEGKTCLVEFRIAYEFASPTLSLLMGGIFDRAFRKFAAAFEDRADVVYGKAP
ncbi:MAG TPA: type II toxin-antitoxin system RatA family toxin [Methylocella sp.]|nr:type II toxin-antitoxin system RatA family toxin [Methylocella sp.]